MRKLTLTGKTCVLMVAFLWASLGMTQRASACSCLVPSVEASYGSSTDVVAVEVQWSYVIGDARYYLARVLTTYKGCLTANAWVLLSTAKNSATCGVQLGRNRYLINGSRSTAPGLLPTLQIGLCAYNVPLSQLTAHDRDFLAHRNVCCGDACACADGAQPVSCFVDPCSVAPACDEGKCEANYCGGCNAEFYDQNHNAVCEEPVTPTQPTPCKSNQDCGGSEWCRQVQPADPDNPQDVSECVPFAQAGESCGGFTWPWYFKRCAPNLVCDVQEELPDAPGVCRP